MVTVGLNDSLWKSYLLNRNSCKLNGQYPFTIHSTQYIFNTPLMKFEHSGEFCFELCYTNYSSYSSLKKNVAINWLKENQSTIWKQ